MPNEQQSDLFELDAESVVELLEQNNDGLECSKSWAPTLRDLVAVMHDELLKTGLVPEQAFKLAQRLVLRQSHFMGGKQYYLPRDERMKKALRDIKIFYQFSGFNIRELSESYQLTSQQIYCVIREQKALWRERNQYKLF